jgi:hypothetical protein
MNLTGTSTLPRFGRQINWHFLMLALGIAVAAVALLTAGALGSSDTKPAKTTAQVESAGAIQGAAQSAAAQRSILYVVASDNELAALQHLINESSVEAPGVERSVMVAGSAEDEIAVVTANGEAAQLGNFEVVDLRK